MSDARRCPLCARRTTTRHLAQFFRCAKCERATGTRGEELTGARRDKALAAFALWLTQHPSCWDRATDGLRMFIIDNGRAYWP